MQLHLDEIAKDVAPGRHAVLLLDQAGWHMSSKLDVPGNLTLVPLPAKCPELNPAENVWEFMRDNWLSNRVFHNADDLIDHCCEAWNKLRSQPWRLMSIGMREWAHKFSSTILGISRLFDSHFEEGCRNPRLVGDFALVLAFKEFSSS